MFQDTMAYLHTIKGHSGRIFIKFERNEDGFKVLFCVCSIGVFAKLWAISIMNHVLRTTTVVHYYCYYFIV